MEALLIGEIHTLVLLSSCVLTQSDCSIVRMAPEVLSGNQGISEKSDVYSFGVILWELVTREVPWRELGHPQAIIWAVSSEGKRYPRGGGKKKGYLYPSALKQRFVIL